MSKEGSALREELGGATEEQVAIQNDAYQQKDPAVEADLWKGKMHLYNVTFAFSSSHKCGKTQQYEM